MIHICVYTHCLNCIKYKEARIVPTKWSDVDMARLAQLANVHWAYRTCLDKSSYDLWIPIPQDETNSSN